MLNSPAADRKWCATPGWKVAFLSCVRKYFWRLKSITSPPSILRPDCDLHWSEIRSSWILKMTNLTAAGHNISRWKNRTPDSVYESDCGGCGSEAIGKLLVRRGPMGWTGGFILERRLMRGNDLGCHAKAGKTQRTAVMYGPPGCAYIYFTYGMHWMLNAVTGVLNHPGAVLIREIHSMIGLDLMDRNRTRLKPGKKIAHHEDGQTDQQRSARHWI